MQVPPCWQDIPLHASVAETTATHIKHIYQSIVHIIIVHLGMYERERARPRACMGACVKHAYNHDVVYHCTTHRRFSQI